jgi:hypothetical protein
MRTALLGYLLLTTGYAAQLVAHSQALHAIGHVVLAVGCGFLGVHYLRRLRATHPAAPNSKARTKAPATERPDPFGETRDRLSELQQLLQEGRIDRTVHLLLLNQIVSAMSLEELDDLRASGALDEATYQVLRVQVLERITGI